MHWLNSANGFDFAFMSAFMKEVEQDILRTTLKFFKDRHIVNNPKMWGGG